MGKGGAVVVVVIGALIRGGWWRSLHVVVMSSFACLMTQINYHNLISGAMKAWRRVVRRVLHQVTMNLII
jgi:hypothetical protein